MKPQFLNRSAPELSIEHKNDDFTDRELVLHASEMGGEWEANRQKCNLTGHKFRDAGGGKKLILVSRRTRCTIRS